ncbi:MAG: hypothetical protein KDF58_02355 [Alphaproteobacteria bacterium]|nr:hypothetical protein [Alphaproteobacteria bacterium]
MTLEEFDTFCNSLKSATKVIQWGKPEIWKTEWLEQIVFILEKKVLR